MAFATGDQEKARTNRRDVLADQELVVVGCIYRFINVANLHFTARWPHFAFLSTGARCLTGPLRHRLCLKNRSGWVQDLR